jgi:RNA polymerase sigma-70 factor (ECF subfamily)
MAPQPLRQSSTPVEREPVVDLTDAGGGSVSPWRFRLAVLLHDRAVFRAAAGLLRDAREAEDVTQEAFLAYWQHGAAVEKPREWLLRVARNAALGRLRKSGRMLSYEEHALPEPSDARDPSWHYQQQELAGELRKLVDALPEPQRSLIVLFDVQGLDGAACARVLGLNVNQVKVYLHRARRKLREQLEQAS